MGRRWKKTPKRNNPYANAAWWPPAIPGAVGEASIISPYYTKSTVRRHADRMKGAPTSAERKLIGILNSLKKGVLKGSFRSQHVVSGRWIVDIFFHEIRLAIEVDGSVHNTAEQKNRDRQKERDCARFDITLLRLTNAEVFGDRERLIQQLRNGWREALDRENKLVGNPRDVN